MVGATFACSLLKTPSLGHLRVAVIEPRAPASLQWCREQTVPDQRVFSISDAGRNALQFAGAWDAIASGGRAAAFSHMQVWDALGSGCLRWSASDVDTDQLGWVVESRVLQAALWAQLELCASSVLADSGSCLDLICPATVVSARFPRPAPWEGPFIGADTSGAATGSGEAASAPLGGAGEADSLAELTLSDGLVVRASLVVAADGAQSKVRSLAGIGACKKLEPESTVLELEGRECGTYSRVSPTSSLQQEIGGGTTIRWGWSGRCAQAQSSTGRRGSAFCQVALSRSSPLATA